MPFAEAPDFTDSHMPYFEADGRLYGSFWIGTAGWTTFSSGSTSYAQIIFGSGLFQSTGAQALAYVTGAAWSPNAGWIALGKDAIDTGSGGVYYNPNKAGLEGFGWNTGLGWVPIFTNVDIDDREDDSPNPTVGAGTG